MSKPKIVILTGAGISAESGVATFRDPDDVWAKFDLGEVAAPQGFARNPARVQDFYNMRGGSWATSNPTPRMKPWPGSRRRLLARSSSSPRTSMICMSVPASES